MITKKIKSEVVSLIKHFDDIYSIEFKSLGGKFKFNPGQFLHLAIDNNYDGSGQWPDSRCFSIQSNPDEQHLRITFSVKGKFTKQMEQQLKVNSVVWLKLPYGNLFTQPHKTNNTVFIAGGTGITPFLSLFTHKSFSKYINPRLYLGFRSKKYNIYESELNKISTIRSEIDSLDQPFENRLSNFLHISYQDIDGVLDIQTIFTSNGPNSDYFISGPPAMIKSFKKSLIENGVSETNILTDDWE